MYNCMYAIKGCFFFARLSFTEKQTMVWLYRNCTQIAFHFRTAASEAVRIISFKAETSALCGGGKKGNRREITETRKKKSSNITHSLTHNTKLNSPFHWQPTYFFLVTFKKYLAGIFMAHLELFKKIYAYMHCAYVIYKYFLCFFDTFL